MTTTAAESISETLASSADEVADGVVCFAGVDWWYHNRGHSECQLMVRLAKRMPVLWVNSLGMRAPTPGKTELPYRRYLRKFKSTIKGLRRDESGMWVYSPLFIPRYTPAAAEWNGRIVSLQVRALCRLLGIKRPASFVTIPTAAPAVARGRWVRTVFNRSDDFSAFAEADASFVRPLEKRLLENSDSVIYVNRRLFARERGAVRNARYLGHGVDFTHFAAPTTSVSEAIQSLPRPIVGFYGALDNYTVDLELLIKVARRLRARNGTLLIIGPKAMDISSLQAEPNVVYLGQIPYSEIPAHAAQFDVALMPWLENDWIAGCNPIKLKEYLAIGFPIVTTRFDELAPYEHLVYAARGHDQFLEQLDRALVEKDASRVEVRRNAVCGDSWDALARTVGEMLGTAAR